jgi:hypothetical protein
LRPGRRAIEREIKHKEMRDRLDRSMPISAFVDDEIAQHSSNSSTSNDPPDNLPIAKRLRQLKGSKEGTGDVRRSRRIHHKRANQSETLRDDQEKCFRFNRARPQISNPVSSP